MLKRVWRKGNPPTLLVGMKVDVATMKIIRKFLKKLKIELSSDPAVLLLGIYLDKATIKKIHAPFIIYSKTIYSSQDMETTIDR